MKHPYHTAQPSTHVTAPRTEGQGNTKELARGGPPSPTARHLSHERAKIHLLNIFLLIKLRGWGLLFFFHFEQFVGIQNIKAPLRTSEKQKTAHFP